MRRYFAFLLLVMASGSLDRAAAAQEPESDSSAQRIEVLELKLKLAEVQIEALQQQRDALLKENAALKNGHAEEAVAGEDQFAAGVVWAGTSKTAGKKDKLRWALSISKRDGVTFEGAVAALSPDGKKIEFPVSGKAPRSGDGLVIIESPLIGRPDVYARHAAKWCHRACLFWNESSWGEVFWGGVASTRKLVGDTGFEPVTSAV